MTAYRARNGAVRLRRLVTGSAEWIVGLIATIEIMILIVAVFSLFAVSDR